MAPSGRHLMPVSSQNGHSCDRPPDSVPFPTNFKILDRFKTEPSYVVLRLDPRAHEWLASARRSALDAPDWVRALLTGRSRVEVGLAEAERALAWAAQLPRWHRDGRPALVRVHARRDAREQLSGPPYARLRGAPDFSSGRTSLRGFFPKSRLPVSIASRRSWSLRCPTSPASSPTSFSPAKRSRRSAAR
jgi:hypothetical protein